MFLYLNSQWLSWSSERVGDLCVSIVICLLAVVYSAHAYADLVFDIPEVTALGDGVNPTTGTFDVILTLTGSELASPPDVSSFNIDFNAVGTSSSSVTFVAKSTPTISPLFTGGTLLDFSTSGQNVEVAHDIFDELPGFSASFDGAKLVTVTYSVDAGFFGEIPLDFTIIPPLNEITGPPLALPFSLSLSNGSLTIVAVPEPSLFVAWGAGAIGIAGWSRYRRSLSLPLRI